MSVKDFGIVWNMYLTYFCGKIDQQIYCAYFALTFLLFDIFMTRSSSEFFIGYEGFSHEYNIKSKIMYVFSR